MTKTFGLHYYCANCGFRNPSETNFCDWMRHRPALDSQKNHIVRTDTDHWVLRYKTPSNGREVQLLMAIEVKEHNAEPNPWQVNVLSFVRQMVEGRGENLHHKKANITKRLLSKGFPGRPGTVVRVRWMGVHLLQFEKTSPSDGKTKWNGKEVSPEVLEQILAMDRSPHEPDRMMDELLRDRHAKVPEFNFITA